MYNIRRRMNIRGCLIGVGFWCVRGWVVWEEPIFTVSHIGQPFEYCKNIYTKKNMCGFVRPGTCRCFVSRNVGAWLDVLDVGCVAFAVFVSGVRLLSSCSFAGGACCLMGWASLVLKPCSAYHFCFLDKQYLIC